MTDTPLVFLCPPHILWMYSLDETYYMDEIYPMDDIFGGPISNRKGNKTNWVSMALFFLTKGRGGSYGGR